MVCLVSCHPSWSFGHTAQLERLETTMRVHAGKYRHTGACPRDHSEAGWLRLEAQSPLPKYTRRLNGSKYIFVDFGAARLFLRPILDQLKCPLFFLRRPHLSADHGKVHR